MPDRLRGQRVLVMGLGRLGGGAGVARFAAEAGADVTVTDIAPAEKLGPGLEAIADLVQAGRVHLRLGSHPERVLDECDLLIVNPAVPRPWAHPYVATARARGVRSTTEIGMLVRRLRERTGRVIGITGTMGKSTTSAMIHHALAEQGVPCFLGGNIGGSLLSSLDRIDGDSTVVLELSSAMLWWLGETVPGWAPRVAVVTGFEPNHIDWHGSLEHYESSKRMILAGQRGGDHAVLGPGVSDWESREGVHRHTPASGHVRPMSLPGAHNRENAAAAIAAVAAMGHDPARAGEAIARFPGLAHRLQSLGARRGVLCFNDSKSTTPGSAAIAVAAVREKAKDVHLIAGGADKKIDLFSIASLEVAGLYTIGQTGPAITECARQVGRPAETCGTLQEAVRIVASRAKAGEAILLSPGCASWDQFENFEHRGEVFARLIEEHLGTPDAR
ncbi:MAG: UDP-N-acetylmuramoyl-L-alanine--D-glutamate ligase [Phycisphaeraceae bacterium]|nr:MAG: UDP-N-acetylmuramoyl-L-alanine--D-glutamate ligase [Phycisphaeraceae bacterium]